MKKIVAAVLVACLMLCGCKSGNGVSRDKDSEMGSADARFICDKGQYTFDIVVDSHTGISYLTWNSNQGQYSVGGITPLLNADGTLVISEEVVE